LQINLVSEKAKKPKNKSIWNILKKHPEWLPRVVTHEDMLADGYVESFRIKRDGFEKDEIWYRKK
jgi:hypothetical protein